MTPEEKKETQDRAIKVINAALRKAEKILRERYGVDAAESLLQTLTDEALHYRSEK